MLRGVANQGVELFHHPVKKHLVVDHAAAIGQTLCLTLFVIDVDQVDVAGHVQLGRAQLAHAHDPQLRHIPLRCAWQAMAQRHTLRGFLQSQVQTELGQPGHGLSDRLQRRLLFAVQHHQPLHHQLPQHTQSICRIRPFDLQTGETSGQHLGVGCPGWQLQQVCRIATAQTLHQSRAFSAGIEGVVHRCSVDTCLPVIIQIA